MKLTQADGRIALIYRAVPVVFGLILVANVVALYVLGRMGGTARGDRVEIVFTTACPTDAAAVIAARVDAMGLGEPQQQVQGDTVRLVATLPGLDDDRTAVPALLAREGRLQVRHGDQVLATEADLSGVTVALDESGMPYDELSFQGEVATRLAQAVDADPKGELVFLLDGEELARRPNSVKILDEKVKVTAGEGITRDRMRRAADRAIVLDSGPQPCPVSVASVGEAE